MRDKRRKSTTPGSEPAAEDGWCGSFGAIDHCVDELVGRHTARIGDRWAALEPLRQLALARHGVHSKWDSYTLMFVAPTFILIPP